MGLLCDRQVCTRKPPWQGLACSYLYQKESRLEKKISLQSSNNAKTGETPHQDEDDEHHGTVEDEVTEFDTSSDEVVQVKRLWKKKVIYRICKLLEMSIFLWAHHPDFAGL